ncbi:MAG: hypothetical protein MUO63_21945 [Desulfobulbaceae bacterium]|nr:hypothetical protein [Desulfobulbaceae bacterium]
MTGRSEPNPPNAVPGDNAPCAKKVEGCSANKYKLIDLTLTVDAPNDKFIMNDPEKKFAALATVTYAKSADPKDLDTLPTKVKFFFTDPSSDNTTKTDSYEYTAGKFLGKKGDAAAVLWEAHADNAATSDDSYKQTAKVTTTNIEAQKKMTAKVYFKPSGVGGDDYKIKAAVLSPDGATELLTKESNLLVVWRKVSFDKIYEMQGETHVSTNAATATISPVYDPVFVEYSAGARTELAATYSLKYIGLWTDAATPQQSWATVQQKQPDETPTAQEITRSNYAGADPGQMVTRDTARASIISKAQRWVDRIDAAFNSARDKWVADAGIPSNALVGIQYYHPKYSGDGGDAQTSEWNLGGASTPGWLRVSTFSGNYTNIDPDAGWVAGGGSWVGLSHGNGIVTVPKRTHADAAIRQTVRHEAGHATKSFFKRDAFGPSLDHSASNAGIMYYSSALGGTTFSDREKKILRGIKP